MAALPDLEVEVRARGFAGRANLAEPLAGEHVLAWLHHDRALLEVHERVVALLAVAVEHHVVTGAAGLIIDVLDPAASRSHHVGAFRRRDVLALVRMAFARRAEA